MSPIPFFLAAAETEHGVSPWHLLDPGTLEWLLIFGAVAVITLLAMLWAAFFRKEHRRGHSHRRHHSRHQSSERVETEASQTSPDTPSSPEKHSRSRRSRRRRHHHHYARNPTLAETGGLPPVRSEDPPAPAP